MKTATYINADKLNELLGFSAEHSFGDENMTSDKTDVIFIDVEDQCGLDGDSEREKFDDFLENAELFESFDYAGITVGKIENQIGDVVFVYVDMGGNVKFY